MENTNRKLFITELGKYLSSMPPEERDAVINNYESLFDETGPKNEQYLLDRLGSPMKVAISILREGSAPESDPLDNQEHAAALKADGECINGPLLPLDATALTEIDSLEAGSCSVSDDTSPADSPEQQFISIEIAGEDEEPPEGDEMPGIEDIDLDEYDDDEDEDEDDMASAPASGAPASKSGSPPAGVLVKIGCVLLSIITALLGFLLVAAPAGLITLGIFGIIAGFASFAYLPDALLLLGAGAMAVGAGIAVAWLIIRGGVSVIRAMVKIMRSGRAVPDAEGGDAI